jgi:hypothetical protein
MWQSELIFVRVVAKDGESAFLSKWNSLINQSPADQAIGRIYPLNFK